MLTREQFVTAIADERTGVYENFSQMRFEARVYLGDEVRVIGWCGIDSSKRKVEQMKPQRRRKHKYARMLRASWEFFHLHTFPATFMAMEIHFKAMDRFPQLHPRACEFCRHLGIWFRIP